MGVSNVSCGLFCVSVLIGMNFSLRIFAVEVNLMTKKRQTPFNRAHELEFGLRICARDSRTGIAESVQCMFCTIFGRESAENKAGRKRNAADTIKYFKTLFRVDNYIPNHEGQRYDR